MQARAIMFHHFRDNTRHPAGQGAISASELRELLLHVGVKRILPAREFLHRHLAGKSRPEDLCLTFDDNIRCQWDVAVPVLNELGLTAFWFVYTSVLDGQIEPLEVYRYFRTTCFANVDSFYAAFEKAMTGIGYSLDEALVNFDPAAYLKPFPFYTRADRRFRYLRDEMLGPDRYDDVMNRMFINADVTARDLARNLWMTADHLRQLHSAGHVIGLHSHSHPTRLNRLSSDAQREEYTANHSAITRIVGEAPIAMSHPCNSYSNETLAILRDMGIRLGFRSNTAMLDGSELELSREDHSNVLRDLSAAA